MCVHTAEFLERQRQRYGDDVELGKRALRRERAKSRAPAQRERAKQRHKFRYENDPEYQERFDAKRREKLARDKEIRRQRYETDPEYRRRNIARSLEWQRSEAARVYRQKKHASIPKQYSTVKGAKRRARDRGWEFNITVDNIHWPTHCPVLGIKLNYTRGKQKKATDASPSLDRWDTTKGYTVENVRVISYRANRLKSNATPQELMAVAKYAMGWI